MTARTETPDNWQGIGEIARRLVEEKARLRCNASGHDRQNKENGDE